MLYILEARILKNQSYLTSGFQDVTYNMEMDKVLFALGSFSFVCIFRHREVERTLNLTSGGLGSISDFYSLTGEP